MSKSKYASFNDDQVEELLSNYIMDSWSYSKLSTFSRNEKEFERCYIYYESVKSSPSTVAGKAYHSAQELFWENYKVGKEVDIVDLERYAYDYIDDISADSWKIQNNIGRR